VLENNGGGKLAVIKVTDKENCHPYWPNKLRAEGYVGILEIHEGVCSLVIPKPNTSHKDIAKDLKILAQQFEYRAQIEEQASE